MYDTVKGGDYLVDQDAAEILAREAIETVIELEHMGLPFNRTRGRQDRPAPLRRAHAQLRRGARPARLLRGRPHRPHDPADALPAVHQARRRVLRRVPRGGPAHRGRRDARRRRLRIADGELHIFHAKAVLFATGGFGRMFEVTSNAHALTGDGVAIAYRRGLPLEDMEFFQFHPTGIFGSASCCRRRRAAKAASCSTTTASASWSATRRRCTTWRRATWSAARSTWRSARRPRHRRQGLRLPRPAPPGQGGHRREAARHHRVRARLPGHRADHGAGADPADGALRHGRHPDRHRGARGDRRRRHGGARPVRRGRVRLRQRPRRQPPGHQLAGRPPRLRPPRRPGDGRGHARRQRRSCRRCRRTRTSRSQAEIEGMRAPAARRERAAHPARDADAMMDNVRRVPDRQGCSSS